MDLSNGIDGFDTTLTEILMLSFCAPVVVKYVETSYISFYILIQLSGGIK